MRVKALVLLSALSGALGLFTGATPAHACTAELPSTACVYHDVCKVAGPKICR